MNRRRAWMLAIVLAIPLATLIAQRGGRRRAPGTEPNPNVAYDGRFTFLRVRFEPLGGGWDLKWDHDYPRAENHFMKILQELTSVKPHMEGAADLVMVLAKPFEPRRLLNLVLQVGRLGMGRRPTPH